MLRTIPVLAILMLQNIWARLRLPINAEGRVKVPDMNSGFSGIESFKFKG